MDYTITEATDTLVYGRLPIYKVKEIEKKCRKRLKKSQEQGSIGSESDGEVDLDTRKSTISWLKSKHLRDELDEFIQEINHGFFDLNIDDLTYSYQITLYDDTNDHYDWHQDRFEDDELDEDRFVRELSMSICLSPTEFYEGAEFFIEDGSDTNIRVFKMKYGDFCIFPSTVNHKVNPLREGERLSLVAWYGYYDN